MGLSNKLVSKFVKTTKNDTKKSKSEKIVYGNILEEGIDSITNKPVYYVRIDGANDNTLIPVTKSTCSMEDIDTTQKVIIMIKDHTALIMGNLDVPAANGTQVRKEVNRRIDSEFTPIDLTDIEALWSSDE